ncbi:unnamed protein product [Microthlaspi erraticum]|uniref:DUF220 domain-containing protein n=1 Tax=Microthlaspi erraticum TaxID=1685480 RepID=A0A6D2JF86_9BRAS|nr:unnamed protein product [Microthlaspi erraticum]
MSVFPRFGSWINQNSQQPLKAESNRSENVKSTSEKDTNKKEIYYDKEEMNKQAQLWRDAEKKHPWYDAPPKVKVTTKNGICHVNIELTIGLPPDGVFDLVADKQDLELFQIDKFGRQLMDNKSRKVLKRDGPREIVEVDKALAWDFLFWSGGKYKKEKMMFMKVFEGDWKVEPIFVDQERFCKNRLPKSREEYKRCSRGEGKLASKVTMEQRFQPCTLLNLPPVSWYIRGKTIKTTKTLLTMIQEWCAKIRQAQ